MKLVTVTLLQSADSILTQFEGALQKRALDNFSKRRVDIMLGARVTKVTDSVVELKDGSEVPYSILVWAAGTSPRKLVLDIIASINERAEAENPGQPPPQSSKRKLTVDPWLRVCGAPHVFALGDCSSFESGPLPATAQVAGQEGAYVARLLRKVKNVPFKSDEEMPHPFRFLSLGVMSYIGNDQAVMQIPTSSEKSLPLPSGLVSYLLWASVYAVKQVATRNRVLVLFDWFKTRVFGRDISEF